MTMIQLVSDKPCDDVQGDNAKTSPSPDPATTPPLISLSATSATPSSASSVESNCSQASALEVDLAQISDVKQKRILRVIYEEVYDDQDVGLILPVDGYPPTWKGTFAYPKPYTGEPVPRAPQIFLAGEPYAEESMYNLFSTSLTVPGDARVPVVAKVTNDGTGSLEDLLKEHEAYKHINGGIHGLTPTHFGAYFHDPNTFNLGMKAGLSLLTYEGIQLRTFASLGVEQTTAIYSAFHCRLQPFESTFIINDLAYACAVDYDVEECSALEELESDLGLVQARELGLLPNDGTTDTPDAEEENEEGVQTEQKGPALGNKQEGGDGVEDEVVEDGRKDAQHDSSAVNAPRDSPPTPSPLSSPPAPLESYPPPLPFRDTGSTGAISIKRAQFATVANIKEQRVLRLQHKGMWFNNDVGLILPVKDYPPVWKGNFASLPSYERQPNDETAPLVVLSPKEIAEGTGCSVFSATLAPGEVSVVAKINDDSLGAFEALLRESEKYDLVGGGIDGATPRLLGTFTHDAETFKYPIETALLFLTDEGDPLLSFAGLEKPQREALYTFALRLHQGGLCHQDLRPGSFLYNRSTGQVRIIGLGSTSVSDHTLLECGCLEELRIALALTADEADKLDMEVSSET
ncbi:hypothetical protein RTBOTA2_001998 [Rhodotorula toruloides]|nr:hypothetical protein RTBOTA2_001998 [Rhodotorula toruloides]